MKWFPSRLEESVCTNLLLRLDEYNIGGVNVTTLDDFVGTKSLQAIVATYKQGQPLRAPYVTPTRTPSLPDSGVWSTSSQVSSSSGIDQISVNISSESITQRLQTPLLVWVDDNPQNNKRHIKYADQEGLPVLEMESTAEAKIWIDENLGIPLELVLKPRFSPCQQLWPRNSFYNG
jgi:hypothetical protein